MQSNLFLNMIQTLRQQEEVMLYGNIMLISDEDAKHVTAFLKSEYQKEIIDHPFKAPAFDDAAALWAAKTVYISAQLMLYRENKGTDLELLLPAFQKEAHASEIMSADLCLRFLPDILVHLKLIDPEDILIPILENFLNSWHYSGVTYPLKTTDMNFSAISANACLQQLYVNRIIQSKNTSLAKLPAFEKHIAAALGLYTTHFWNDFKLETHHDESY
ncbi:MAG: hypothetical protein V4580_09980 [Bacteroidota bacterium]